MPHSHSNFSVHFVISVKGINRKFVFSLFSVHRHCKLSKVCSSKVEHQQAGFSQCTFLHAVVSAVLIMCFNRSMCAKCHKNTHTKTALSESQCSPGEQRMERPMGLSTCVVKPLQEGATSNVSRNTPAPVSYYSRSASLHMSCKTCVYVWETCICVYMWVVPPEMMTAYLLQCHTQGCLHRQMTHSAEQAGYGAP